MADSSERPVVEVDVLGTMRVRVDGQPVVLSARQPRVVLAVLALAAGRPVSVERLAAAVWEDADYPADVRATVYNYVYRLRRRLGTPAITKEQGGYALRTSPERIDALRMRALVEQGNIADDPELELLEEATGLWRGEPFEDLDCRLLTETETPGLREGYLAALERRADLDLAEGRHAEVTQRLQELVPGHPLRESLWVRLLRALDAAGRFAEAFERYEMVRTRLAEELGVGPGDELRRIHAELLARDKLSAETHVRTTVHDPPPRDLPPDLGGFIGRTAALDTLDRLAERRTAADQVTIVVVHGMGGVGKTSLGVHWGHRAANRFPDGQLLVNLRGYDDRSPVEPRQALETLLRGLGADADRIPEAEIERTRLLRSLLADQRVLLILDDARDEGQVRPLLPGPGNSMAIITSRDQLRGLVTREQAHRFELGPLDLDESVDLLRTSLDAGSVAHDRGTLVDLAEYCGRHPLALAVAAEHTTRHTATRLADVLDDLRGEQPLESLDSPDPTSSLRHVFATSYVTLDTETARIFRLLGLHPGPDIGMPAAAGLAGITAGRAKRLLDRLVAANLLLERRPGRWELHGLVRSYAEELCEQQSDRDVRDAALDRYLDWCVRSASNAAMHLGRVGELDTGIRESLVQPVAFSNKEQAFSWYDAERSSIVAAAHLAAETDRHTIVYQLVFACRHYFVRRRAFGELLDLLFLALQAARQLEERIVEAHVLTMIGTALGEGDDLQGARCSLEAAVARFDAAGGYHDHHLALNNLGYALYQLGELREALTLLERGTTLAEQHGDPSQVVQGLANQISIYRDLGHLDDAVSICERGITLYRDHDVAPFYKGSIWRDLGSVRAAQGRITDGVDCYHQAIDIARADANPWDEGLALIGLGHVLRDSNHTDRARITWQRALEVFDDLGAPDGSEYHRHDLLELLDSVTPAGYA